MSFCTSCGSELTEGSAVCPQCNAEQVADQAPPPPAAPPTAPPPGAAPLQAPLAAGSKTSGLAIASLILSLLGFVSGALLCLPGVILGFVALSKIKKSNGQLGGKGLAIAGICVGGGLLAILFLAIVAAVVIPLLLDPGMASRAKQSEAKQNLGAIFTCEVAYFVENNTYGSNFNGLGWAPEGENRYAYFIAEDVIQARAGGPYQIPASIETYANQENFQALAIGNIDKDDTLDVWAIDDTKFLKNLVNDLQE